LEKQGWHQWKINVVFEVYEQAESVAFYLALLFNFVLQQVVERVICIVMPLKCIKVYCVYSKFFVA